MLNPDYKTAYYAKRNATAVDLIESIAFSTASSYVKWQRKYDETLSSYYYYGQDDDYKEKYYLFIDSPIIGTVLQIVSDKDKLNYEMDDTCFYKELANLSKEVLNMSKKIKNKKYNYYDPYTNYGCGYNNHYTCDDYLYDYYTNYKSYKELKREKADKALKDVEPMRNFETL